MPTTDKRNLLKGVFQYHIHLKPGDIGEFVLLPGDPQRADVVAKYLENAELVAFHREYKTYTGFYKGIKISVTSTGIGCPSASIAVEELANIGAKYFIRIGTTAALQKGINIGDIIISKGSMKNEGTSKFYLPDNFPAIPDFNLTYSLYNTALKLEKDLQFNTHIGINASEDSFYGETPEWLEKLSKMGIMNIEMESSAIFTVCHVRKLHGASICTVASNHIEGTTSITQDEKFKQKVTKGIDDMIKVTLEAIYHYNSTFLTK